MTKKHLIHDSGYKMLFSNPEMVKQLLTCFVNEEWINKIEYNSLEKIDKSFVTDEFSKRESDIIYKASFKGEDVYIFILLEFQSTVDRFMSLRMLRYIAELYEHLIRNHKLSRLPAVFPVMLYNGEKRWTAPEELNILIENSIPEKYIPCFRYYKIAVNEFSKDFLIKLNNTVAALFYSENCTADEISKEINTIVNLFKTEKPGEISSFIHWFRYMFQERSDLVDEIKQLEDVKSMLRTTVKKIAKENRLEGKLEGKLEVAQNLLKEKIPVKKIAELTGLSSEEIKKLKK